jgi:Zn-dependent peptidase ImmA (M78 family)/DNA-binding XRE family transcriptional regulator
MTIGYRIRQARKAARKSMRDLADEVGISAMAISKYERDINVPRSSVLIEIANALGFKVEYFFRPQVVTVTTPEFRCSTMSVKDETAVMACIEESLEPYLEVESLFPDEQTSFKAKYSVSTVEDAEDAAKKLRRKWNLGLAPIESLTEIFEEEGIKITLVDGVEGFDACTFEANGNPVIALRNDIPGDRQRFNLAHELGHIVLRIQDKLEDINEPAAYRFAGAFLVPANSMRQELGEERKTLSFPELYLLKQKYGMSMQAWVYRANDLGIITDNAKSDLFEEITRLGWRKVEPGKQIEPEVPRRFERLVYRALSEGYISRSRAEELMDRPIGGVAPEVLEYYEHTNDDTNH